MPPCDEPSASRYSIAFFNNANKDSVVQVRDCSSLAIYDSCKAASPPSVHASHQPAMEDLQLPALRAPMTQLHRQVAVDGGADSVGP